jgi:hypothetical protein
VNEFSSNLPEKIRRALPKIVKELHSQVTVSSMGLYGSWSRGDAVPTSDLDILVVDRSDQEMEYVERTEIDGISVDYNHVPRKWLVEALPPFLDQKLFETNVFFDSDWSLTVAKNWIQKLYRNKGRIEIRTNNLLLDSDTYLSRVSSALMRKDYESASLFIPSSVEPLAKILLEIVGLPFSNSRLLKNFRLATEMMKKPSLFTSFLRLSNIQKCDREDARIGLSLLEKGHDALSKEVSANEGLLKNMHRFARASIQYHSNPRFMSGVAARVGEMIDSGETEEALLYCRRLLTSFFEDHGILVSAKEGTKIDYSVLTRQLKGVGEEANTMYDIAQESFALKAIDPSMVRENVQFARDMIRSLRRETNLLIEKSQSTGP